MKKRFISMLMMATIMTSLLTGCGSKAGTTSPTDSKEQGKVLNIYCWNEEFKSRYTDYFEKKGLLPEGVKVNFLITPNENNAYQNALDEALRNQDKVEADKKVDIFLVEADYALKYVDTDYTLDVKKDIGLTDADLADQYQYTKDIVTDSKKVQKGTTWQATPGLFVYRRSIAKEVLGTDDPVEVQAALADWKKFDEVAEKTAEKGFKMLSGYDDSFRTFSNNISSPWVDKDNKIVVDQNILNWIDQTKDYTDKGYNNKTSLFKPDWSSDQGSKGNVFGFFYSTWGINFTLLGNSLDKAVADGGKEEVGNGIYGDYAVCEGPQNYYWGGSWICAAKGTDNVDLIRDIMKELTCNEATMKQITLDTQDYTNNQKAMEEIANSDYKSDFLGGQNHIKLFSQAAPKIDMSNISPYDLGLNEAIQSAHKDYFNGTVDKETAMNNFYKTALEKFPELKR